METPEFLPPDGREGRRFRGLHLKQQGWSRHEIAEGLGISLVSVSHWFARVRDGGPEALRAHAHPSPGHPPKLSAAQKRLIPEFLGHDAEAYGFRREVWPDEVLEVLRLRAIRARELGYAVEDIATILGVSRETVSRWCSAYKQGGKESLPGDRARRPIGSGRTLTPEQEEHIRQSIVEHYPEYFGIASALWTRQVVAELIKKEFALAMPIRTVGEYLNRWGFTPQKPTRKSY